MEKNILHKHPSLAPKKTLFSLFRISHVTWLNFTRGLDSDAKHMTRLCVCSRCCTPSTNSLKTNISPKHWWLEDENSWKFPFKFIFGRVISWITETGFHHTPWLMIFFTNPLPGFPQGQNTKKKLLTVKIWRKNIRSKYEAPKYLQMEQVLDGEFPASSHLLLAKVFKMPGIMVVLTISKPIVLAEFQLKGWVSLFLLEVRQTSNKKNENIENVAD